MRAVFGMDERTYQPCPVPGHRGVAWFEEHDDYGLMLRCNCLGTELKWDERWPTDCWRPLCDVYRAIRTGKTIGYKQKVSAGERLVWSLLLAHEVGSLAAVNVELPPLPPDASELEDQVAGFYRLLAGLRLAVGRELATPLSVSLVMAYLGVTDRGKAADALRALRDAGVLVGSREPNSYFVYVPGELSQR